MLHGGWWTKSKTKRCLHLAWVVNLNRFFTLMDLFVWFFVVVNVNVFYTFFGVVFSLALFTFVRSLRRWVHFSARVAGTASFLRVQWIPWKLRIKCLATLWWLKRLLFGCYCRMLNHLFRNDQHICFISFFLFCLICQINSINWTQRLNRREMCISMR